MVKYAASSSDSFIPITALPQPAAPTFNAIRSGLTCTQYTKLTDVSQIAIVAHET